MIKELYQKYKTNKKLLKAKRKITITCLCTLAHVSSSGYYKWIKKREAREIKYKQEINDLQLIEEIFYDLNSTAGFRTIVMELKQRHNIVMNHKKIIRIMNKYDLVCKIRRKKFYGNTFNKQRIENTYENLLNTTFDCVYPNTIFHTDITYIKYDHGQKTAYLSAIKDEATREIPAYVTSKSLEMPFVLQTLDLLKDQSISSKAIIHSDQGVHYTSKSYGEKIQELGLIGSMSRRGRCVDNSPIETFFGHMKDEVNFKFLKTYEDVVKALDDYFYRYNNLRPQWTLKKMTPKEYRNHLINTA